MEETNLLPFFSPPLPTVLYGSDVASGAFGFKTSSRSLYELDEAVSMNGERALHWNDLKTSPELWRFLRATPRFIKK